MNETRIADLLDELTPSYDDRRGDWERVAAAAGQRRRGRAGVSIALAVAAAVALALAWPFHAQQGSFFERALAAVGDGPVLHVVLRRDWGGTLINLRTGERSPVYGDDEYWYDTETRRVHSVERLGGAVLNEELSRPQRPPVELDALGRDYRHALSAGTARVDGEGTIAGEPVAWITIHSELLPDVADGKDHRSPSRWRYRAGPSSRWRCGRLATASRVPAPSSTSVASGSCPRVAATLRQPQDTR